MLPVTEAVAPLRRYDVIVLFNNGTAMPAIMREIKRTKISSIKLKPLVDLPRWLRGRISSCRTWRFIKSLSTPLFKLWADASVLVHQTKREQLTKVRLKRWYRGQRHQYSRPAKLLVLKLLSATQENALFLFLESTRALAVRSLGRAKMNRSLRPVKPRPFEGERTKVRCGVGSVNQRACG